MHLFFFLKAVFVFSVLLRFLFCWQLESSAAPACYPHANISVPVDDSESVKRNEAHPI